MQCPQLGDRRVGERVELGMQHAQRRQQLVGPRRGLLAHRLDDDELAATQVRGRSGKGGKRSSRPTEVTVSGKAGSSARQGCRTSRAASIGQNSTPRSPG